MIDEAALLAAILDAPEDDAPRLIYSDWLDEQGRCERAEFIKVQCTLAGWSCPALDANPNKEMRVLRRRERELLSWFETHHPGGIRGGQDGNPSRDIVHRLAPDLGIFNTYQYRRGFVHSITLSAADLLAYGDKIIAPVPLPEVILPSWQPVEEVTLTTWPQVEMDPAFEATPYPRYRLVGRTVFTGPDEDYPDGPPTRADRLLILNWPRIKKWTLPP